MVNQSIRKSYSDARARAKKARLHGLFSSTNHKALIEGVYVDVCRLGRRAALSISLFALFSLVLMVNFSSVEVEASNGQPVNNLNTNMNYTTIQEAIDTSETLSGHTILVKEGTYYENVIVTKSLTLIGESREGTVIDGAYTGNVMQIDAPEVSVMNFTLRNAGDTWEDGYPNSCLLVVDVKNVIIEDNTIANGVVGVLGYASSNITIRHNLVYNCCLMGIHLDGNSSLCEIVGNKIEDNLEGIELERSSNSVIEGNTLKGNNVSIVLNQCNGLNTLRDNNMSSEWYNLIVWGWSLEAFIQDIDPTNIVNNKVVYYIMNSSNLIINPLNHPDLGFLAIVDCKNVTVQDLDISLNKDGVLLAHAENCVLTSNTLTGNSGPLFHGGLTLFRSDGNLLIGNRVANNSVGVGLHQSDGNVFYHNSFVHNTRHVIPNFHSPFSEPSGPYSIARWENYMEGNYWSDYYGNDSNKDGIGDSPYIVTQDPTTPPELMQYDEHPLMAPITSFNAGKWDDKTYYVNVISNSTVTGFHFDPTQFVKHFSFNVTGSEGTDGFCRVSFQTALLQGPYIVSVNNTHVTPSGMSNGTHYFLHFNYNHSTQTAIVGGTGAIPEHPSPTILAILMVVTPPIILMYRRKHH